MSKAHLEVIREKRASNNDLWMKILEIALEEAPERTKLVLKAIRDRDLTISHCLGRIVDEDRK